MNIQQSVFQKKIFIQGRIKTLTGLHIGGNSTEMSIGGADLIVVRDPLTNYPYIPGSSLRGKMRALFEKYRDEMTIIVERDNKEKVYHSIKEAGQDIAKAKKIKSAGPCTKPEAVSAKLFGIAVDNKEQKFVPQRLIVRDAKLTKRSAEELKNARHTDMPLTEVKTEVTIDRITSQANPRQIERVPAGAEFEFEFILNLYGDDKEEDYLGYSRECMSLLQDDYLGGHGSRGYGRIKFIVESIKVKTKEDYQKNRDASSLDVEVPENFKEVEDNNKN